MLCKKNIKPGKYLIKNNKNVKLKELIDKFNYKNNKKIKIIWLSNKIIKEKIYPYSQLKNWKPLKSNIVDIINNIKI